MKKWRVGTVTMGVFLVFLGAALFIGQIDKHLSSTLLQNWWPFLLVVVGVEILLANFIINKEGVQYSLNGGIIVLVCFLGLISLGVYSLQTTGLWNRLTDVVSGRMESLTYLTDLSADGIEKVVLEPGDFWGSSMKIWDGQAGQVRLHIHGRAYRDDSLDSFARILAPACSLERIGKTAVIRLREFNGETPWSPRVDAVDIIIPPGVTFETVERDNLDLQGYTGKLSKVRDPRQIMTELIQTQAELKAAKARMQQIQRSSAQQLEALRRTLQTSRNTGKPQP